MNSKPRRAQGGKGLLSRSISVQNPQESMAKNPSPREERTGTGRKRGGRHEGGVLSRQKERERGGEGVFMVPTQGSKIPLDLN